MPSITGIRGRIYPDRSFSLGVVPRQKKGVREREYDRLHCTQEEVNFGCLSDWLEGKTDIKGEFVSISENPDAKVEVIEYAADTEAVQEVLYAQQAVDNRDFSRFYDCDVDMERPLLVKSLKSSQKKRNPYGKHGITNFGRRVCKNACILLEREYGLDRLGFGTCTIPSIDEEVCKAIIGNWSDISRRFYQKIRRICEKRKTAFIYVGCTEIQEKRFSHTGLPVPHLHFVYVSKASARSGYSFSTVEAYSAWNDAVNEVLVLRGGKPIMGTGGHKGSVKLEPIHTSASAYIGKYISKGATVVDAMQEKGYSEFPKQWWTACKRCKKMFKESVVRMDANTCTWLFYDYEFLYYGGYLDYIRPVYIEYGGASYRCGLTGTLSKEFYNLIVSQLKIK